MYKLKVFATIFFKVWVVLVIALILIAFCLLIYLPIALVAGRETFAEATDFVTSQVPIMPDDFDEPNAY